MKSLANSVTNSQYEVYPPSMLLQTHGVQIMVEIVFLVLYFMFIYMYKKSVTGMMRLSQRSK